MEQTKGACMYGDQAAGGDESLIYYQKENADKPAYMETKLPPKHLQKVLASWT